MSRSGLASSGTQWCWLDLGKQMLVRRMYGRDSVFSHLHKQLLLRTIQSNFQIALLFYGFLMLLAQILCSCRYDTFHKTISPICNALALSLFDYCNRVPNTRFRRPTSWTRLLPKSGDLGSSPRSGKYTIMMEHLDIQFLNSGN